jgi:hypothetical protein
VIADALKGCRARIETRQRTGSSKKTNERRVDPSARPLVPRPVKSDAFRLGVVARGVSRKVPGRNEEQPDVSAADARDSSACAQEAVDRRFLGVHIHPAAVRTDQSYSSEAFRGGRTGQAERECGGREKRRDDRRSNLADRVHNVPTMPRLDEVRGTPKSCAYDDPRYGCFGRESRRSGTSSAATRAVERGRSGVGRQLAEREDDRITARPALAVRRVGSSTRVQSFMRSTTCASRTS